MLLICEACKRPVLPIPEMISLFRVFCNGIIKKYGRGYFDMYYRTPEFFKEFKMVLEMDTKYCYHGTGQGSGTDLVNQIDKKDLV